MQIVLIAPAQARHLGGRDGVVLKVNQRPKQKRQYAVTVSEVKEKFPAKPLA